MPTKILLKRGLNANFSVTPLDAGEPAFVTDTGKLYVGDGTTKVLINPIEQPAGLDTSQPFTKVTVNTYGQVVTQASLIESDIPDISYTKVTGLGSAANANLGTASGNVPVLDVDGKLNSSTLPAIAVTDTFTVADETEMLALTAQTGDIAVRSDLNKTFILKQTPASELANWVELLTPTQSVLSVNGKTGAVVLAATDIDMTGYVKPASYSAILDTDNSSDAIGKLEKNFDNYATTASPTLTGTPTAPTQLSTDNSQAIATTAFVQSLVSTIDGGTF